MHFLSRPTQIAHRLIRLLTARIINFAIALDGTVKEFFMGNEPLRKVGYSVPAINQDGSVADLAGSQLFSIFNT